MTHTDEGNTMMRLVAALHAHIAREEEERRRNPEAWLAMLTVRTQQQWALLECIRTERERREAQTHPDRARSARVDTATGVLRDLKRATSATTDVLTSHPFCRHYAM
jgi:hypothetical protein